MARAFTLRHVDAAAVVGNLDVDLAAFVDRRAA